ncbi:glycosyltransferase [uncultured Phocaeicola sp.]|jgi:glycosyltransferase involved in cell wall biosynthesis|uniref:glycosyltransferase n=1 Tax=uncultured Phocaeicola sp. TaxID=990718 RepID=UPI0015B578E8
MKQHTHLVIVVPCYNEKDVLPEATHKLTDILQRLEESEKINKGTILYVDDGSKDTTWQLIKSFSEINEKVIGIKLAHNVGHQQALWAGLEWASLHADVAVSIDADLQDDVESIITMTDFYNKGIDIVYGVRKERKTDTFFKRNTALLFYKLMHNLGGEIVYNHADFRLMSKRSLQALMNYPERNLFLRGMVCTLGFPSANVYYDRKERFAGESKYPLKKMISFALDGITSFSVRPLRYIVMWGILFILISIIAIIYGIIRFFEGQTIPGWTSLMISLWFIGGAVLTSIGIIGEYIGKIYKEVKQRPRYLIEECIYPKENS